MTLTQSAAMNRTFWLSDYLKSKDKVTFEDLKILTEHQAVANSIQGFSFTLNYNADTFHKFFKERFFTAVAHFPTPQRNAAIALLSDFDGSWFPGDTNQIVNGTDVSDKWILAQEWLVYTMAAIMNPKLAGTSFAIPAVPPQPLPLPNANLVAQLNLLGRILQVVCDNTLFYDGWLNGNSPNSAYTDNIIVTALDNALANLGPQPWGANKRPIRQFTNAVLGTANGQIPSQRAFNASGFYLITEFSSCGPIRTEAVIPLGESGEWLGPSTTPVPNIHSFDQQPLFTHFQLVFQEPLEQTECALNAGICKKCGAPPPLGSFDGKCGCK